MQTQYTHPDQDRFLSSVLEQYPEVPTELAQKLPDLMAQGCPGYFAGPSDADLSA